MSLYYKAAEPVLQDSTSERESLHLWPNLEQNIPSKSNNVVCMSDVAHLPTAFLFWWLGTHNRRAKRANILVIWCKNCFFFSFGAGRMAHICCVCVGLLLIKLMVLFSSNHFSAVNQHNHFRKTPSVDWITKSLVSWKFNRSQSLTESIFMLINSTMEYFLMSHGKSAPNK